MNNQRLSKYLCTPIFAVLMGIFASSDLMAAEMSLPTLKTGYSFEAITHDGKSETTKLISQDDERYHWRRGNCDWWALKADLAFAPTVQWDCRGKTGDRSVSRHDDSFPITFEKKWSYSWGSRERVCTVSPQHVSVTTEHGTHNAFEVTCDEGSKGTSTYYIAPDLGVNVKFVKVRGSKTTGWTLKKILSQ